MAHLNETEAYNVLVAQVHAPVFFNKLASVYGITPQNPEEARELLLIAGELRNAHEQDQVKQAAVQTNFYSEARRDLGGALANSGMQPLTADDDGVKRAAAEAVQNPLVKEAAIVFGQFMAQAAQRV